MPNLLLLYIHLTTRSQYNFILYILCSLECDNFNISPLGVTKGSFINNQFNF